MRFGLALSKIGRAAKRRSPELLAGAGIAGIVGTIILACRATVKTQAIVERHNEVMDEIHSCPESEKYTEEDRKKDTISMYAHTTLRIAKEYAPAIILGVLSVGSLLMSHRILRKRNVALAAAYAAIDKAFSEYRERVKERFGEEVENNILLGVKEETIETVDENGKKHKEKVRVATAPESPFMMYFTKENANSMFVSGNVIDPLYFADWITRKEALLNNKLRCSPILTLELNEALKELGAKERAEGIANGWTYCLESPANPSNPKCLIKLDWEEVWLPNKYTEELERAYAIKFNCDPGGILLKAAELEKANPFSV